MVNNILSVYFIGRDHSARLPVVQCFYARPGQGSSYTTSQLTSVLHHETTPSWSAEVKLGLPLDVNERHHLLFTFYHVSCQPKQGKRGQEAPDAVVGYSWIPLVSKGRWVQGSGESERVERRRSAGRGC